MPGRIEFSTSVTATPLLHLTIQSDGDILVDTDSKMMFRNSDLTIHSSVNGQLDIDANVKLDLAATLIVLTGGLVTLASGVLVSTVNGIDYAPGSDADTDIISVTVTGAPKLWWDESENAFAMTHRLILPEGVQTKYAVDDVADPPTDAQLDTAFGDPTTVGSGFVGILDDNDGGTDCYICWTTGTAGEWFYTKGTKAA